MRTWRIRGSLGDIFKPDRRTASPREAKTQERGKPSQHQGGGQGDPKVDKQRDGASAAGKVAVPHHGFYNEDDASPE